MTGPAARAFSGLACAIALVALVRWYSTSVKSQYSLEHVAPACVDLNHADVGQLTTLPGVEEALALRILRERRHGGPFHDGADLARRVDGIGDKKLQALLPHAVFTP